MVACIIDPPAVCSKRIIRLVSKHALCLLLVCILTLIPVINSIVTGTVRTGQQAMATPVTHKFLLSQLVLPFWQLHKSLFFTAVTQIFPQYTFSGKRSLNLLDFTYSGSGNTVGCKEAPRSRTSNTFGWHIEKLGNL